MQRKTLHIPSEVEMTGFFFYEELSKCKTKAVALSVIEHYSKNYILQVVIYKLDQVSLMQTV